MHALIVTFEVVWIDGVLVVFDYTSIHIICFILPQIYYVCGGNKHPVLGGSKRGLGGEELCAVLLLLALTFVSFLSLRLNVYQRSCHLFPC